LAGSHPSLTGALAGGDASSREEIARRVLLVRVRLVRVLLVRVLLVVARAQRRPRAVGEQLARQEVGRVGPTRDVDDSDAVLEFGDEVGPTRLVVADAALPLQQPLQTSVISVQLRVKGPAEEIRTTRLERVHRSQKLPGQQVGREQTLGVGVSVRRSKATG
jgi:hypothetical protein